MTKPKAKPKPRPATQAHEARAARGRIPTLVQLSPEGVTRLAALAERLDWTKSQVVEEALARMERDDAGA